MRGPLWLDRATAADPPRLTALEALCHSHPWSLGQFEEEVAYGPPGAVLVLRSPGRAVPWADIRAYCVYRLVLDELHILNLAVDPAWRRQGLGGWLLRFALARAARAGAEQALLEVREGNRPALALYDRMGFRPLGTRRSYYSQPAEDAVVLVLDGLAELGGGQP